MSFLGDLFTAPFEAIGDLFGTINGTKQANQLNAALTREQMAWQTAEAAKNREFQDQQRIAQNQWSENQYSKYNSPAAVVNQYRQIGVNPAALYSQGVPSPAQANMSAGSPGQGSVPSSVGVPHMQGTNVLGGLQFISGFMKDMAQASKLGAETSRIQSLMSHEVENFILENKGKEFANAMAKDNAYILHNIKDVKVRQAHQDLQNAAVKALNTQADTDLKELQSINEQYLSLLNEERRGLTREQRINLSMQNDTFMRNFESELNLRRSEVARNRAEAENQSAQAAGQRIFNQLHDNPYFRQSYIDRATSEVREINARIRNIDKNSALTDKQLDQMDYMISQAAYADDMKEFTYWSNQINGFIGTLGSAASQFYGAGALRELINLRRMEQNKPTVPLESGRGFYMNDGYLFRQNW